MLANRLAIIEKYLLKAARTQPFVSANPPKEAARAFPGRFAFDSATVIVVEHLHKQFGGIHAVNDVSLTVEQGTITGLIGPNGAGKTTLFNVIAGVYPPTAGHIYLENEEISGLKPHQLFAKGVLRTFQIAHEFATLTVQENLMMVPANQPGERLIDTWLRPRTVQDQELAIRTKADEVIDFLEIQSIRKTPVGRLPYGLKKRVELARALAAEPSILLLDEPMAGMNVEEKEDMSRFILDVNDEFGTTIALIEHDMGVVMDLSGRVVVMDYGKKIGDGTPDDVRNNQDVIDAYLGVAHD